MLQDFGRGLSVSPVGLQMQVEEFEEVILLPSQLRVDAFQV